MLLCRACRVGHVLVLVLCLSSAEDFDWTKNDDGSFYYGTFPAGKDLFFFPLNFNHRWSCWEKAKKKKMISLIRIFVGCRQFSLSDRRSLGQRWKRSEHLGCVQSQERQSPTQQHWRRCLWGLLQSQGEGGGTRCHLRFKENRGRKRSQNDFTLCCVCATGWCFSHEGDEAESLSLLNIMASNPPYRHKEWVDDNAKDRKDKKRQIWYILHALDSQLNT